MTSNDETKYGKLVYLCGCIDVDRDEEDIPLLFLSEILGIENSKMFIHW